MEWCLIYCRESPKSSQALCLKSRKVDTGSIYSAQTLWFRVHYQQLYQHTKLNYNDPYSTINLPCHCLADVTLSVGDNSRVKPVVLTTLSGRFPLCIRDPLVQILLTYILTVLIVIVKKKIKCVKWRSSRPGALVETFERKVQHFNTLQKVLAIAGVENVLLL